MIELNYFSINSKYPSVALSLREMTELNDFLVEEKTIGQEDSCVITNSNDTFSNETTGTIQAFGCE